MDSEEWLQRRVLVVDDDVNLAQLFQIALQEAGYQVDVAHSANEAMERLKQRSYNIVLSDIRMPGMDGVAFTEAVQEIYPQLPVVLITGYGDTELAREALQAGAVDYLEKPISVKALPSIVERNIERKRLDQRRLERFAQRLYREVSDTFVALVELSDPLALGHAERVAQIAFRFVQALHLSLQESALLDLAARMHDVGRVCLPRELFHRPGSLSPEELYLVRQYPRYSAEVIGRVKGLQEVAKIVLHQHENWDGTGYPTGLAGEAIPLASRILFLADAYDAMTSTRTYRPPLPKEKALEEIRNQAGRQFDPRLAEVFLQQIAPHL